MEGQLQNNTGYSNTLTCNKSDNSIKNLPALKKIPAEYLHEKRHLYNSNLVIIFNTNSDLRLKLAKNWKNILICNALNSGHNCKNTCHSVNSSPNKNNMKILQKEKNDEKPTIKKRIVLFVPKRISVNSEEQHIPCSNVSHLNLAESTLLQKKLKDITNEQQCSIRHTLPVQFTRVNKRLPFWFNKICCQERKKPFHPNKSWAKKLEAEKVSYKPIRANIYVNDSKHQWYKQEITGITCQSALKEEKENFSIKLEPIAIHTSDIKKDFKNLPINQSIIPLKNEFDQKMETNLLDIIKKENAFEISEDVHENSKSFQAEEILGI